MKPLADIRIVSLEQYGAGPFGSLQLAHLGAEVLKIEDLIRHSDAVYSNLRGDVPARLRITYDDLKSVNPKIVCCSLRACLVWILTRRPG